ncbi:MAG: Cell division protein FtsN [Gammaproteobacteria bacterium]|nr:Cell division protein FtsN [Gammaproteobacteria bacterium]
MAQAAKRKRRASKKRKNSDTGSSWIVLAIGLVCGTVLSALYFGYQENEPSRLGSGIHSLLEKEEQPQRQDKAEEPEKTPEPPRKVKLDFPEVLPNLDEVISESDPIAAEEPVEERPDREYILQAGAYKADQDAEHMKAKLARAGFEAVIQRVNIDNKGTYYRVRMGPYQSKRKLNLDKKRLAKQGIEALALRLEEPQEQIKQTD